MHECHHLRRYRRRDRRALATLEFVMALPLLFLLMLLILFEGFWLIGQTEALITSRNDTWKKRFDNASGDPLVFPVLDIPGPLGYDKAKDYVTEKATKEVDISPAFDAVADPEASHTILAGSWDHQAMPFEKAPHLKLMAVAAAVGTGGNLLDWVSQLTNPVGLVKKFQNFGTGIKSESDNQKSNVGVDDGSTDSDSGTGTPTPPAPDGKTPEQAKEDTEKKREEEIRLRKEDYKRLGGRILMTYPQAGQLVAERGEMKQAKDEIEKLQEDRATKFREMDVEADEDKKKKLQEELAQLQRKIDLTNIRLKRIEQEFLDVSAELDALGVDLWDQLHI